LLTHSGGLPRESDYAYWTERGFPFPTREQIRERLGSQETLYPASRYFQYSNLGLTLAGEIVTATSGQPFDEYVRQQILKPLGMTNTYTDVPVELRGSRLAMGHTAIKRDGMRDIVPPFQTRGIAPAAGFVSNVHDLARFAMWQFRVLESGGDKVLHAASLREMHQVHWTDPDWETTRGLGFAVSREGDRTFVSHGGGCPGYYTYLRLEPKTKIAAIVLTNAIGSETKLYTGKAFDLIGPAIKKALDKADSIPKRDVSLDRYVGIYDSIWRQMAVVRWEECLAMLDLSTRDPKKDLVKLKKSGKHTFRRIRDDDESLGETVEFDVDENGVVRRLKRHSNWMVKLR
jgi:CubicO group peptidase (beta-lactamase class C family)